MPSPNPDVDIFLAEGCGRCPLVATPQCKVNTWREAMHELRAILLETPLTEERKWGVACYTYDGKNVALMSALRERVVLGFLKGVLLKDPHGVLVAPGKNSQADRQFNFTSVEEVLAHAATITAYVDEAIEIEKAGLQVEFKKNPEPMPDELLQKFDEDPAFEAAFLELTPGRQRGYILYFSDAKQAKTRHSRIEKYTPRIFEGRGMHDR